MIGPREHHLVQTVAVDPVFEDAVKFQLLSRCFQGQLWFDLEIGFDIVEFRCELEWLTEKLIRPINRPHVRRKFTGVDSKYAGIVRLGQKTKSIGDR